MSHPFEPPTEPVEALRPVLSAGDAARLSYVHSTLGPKVIVGLGLMGVAAIGFVSDALSFAGQGLGLATMMPLALHVVEALAGLTAAGSGVQGFLATEEEPEKALAALDTEALFWQLAGGLAAAMWAFALLGCLVGTLLQG
jgi:hypothetical protein